MGSRVIHIQIIFILNILQTERKEDKEAGTGYGQEKIRIVL